MKDVKNMKKNSSFFFMSFMLLHVLHVFLFGEPSRSDLQR